MFSEKFIVDIDLVSACLMELRTSGVGKEVREKENKEKRKKLKESGYEDFKWDELIAENTLKKQIHERLDKYLHHHKLYHFKKLLKPQKIEAIIHHYYLTKSQMEPDDGGTTTFSFYENYFHRNCRC